MANDKNIQDQVGPGSSLAPPPIVPAFAKALDDLVAAGKVGHRRDSLLFNPPDEWLISNMPVIQDLPQGEKAQVLGEAEQLRIEAQEANAAGKAATRAWPGAVIRLDNGGLAFFSQLGVVRRPDLTQYFIDGFSKNRDALAFSEDNQELFAQVLARIASYMEQKFASGETIVQSDRQIGDAPGRSFHARQLLFGSRYLQVPYMWRQLTFDLPEGDQDRSPDILEVTIPNWLDDLGLDENLKNRIKGAGFQQLVFKAPTKRLSLHLGFDYVGEHKMGPLSIAMFLVKQAKGLAIQAALSVARAKTLAGVTKSTALVTTGPSLHGKSTLTIMLELENSDLANLLGLTPDPQEGVYPMNDDILLIQKLDPAIRTTRGGNEITISHSIDGTENSFYAVPFGLNHEDDPITYDVLRGTQDSPNSQETLENVLADPENGLPDYSQNPVRNMRMILSRPRLLERKGSDTLLETITNGVLKDSVHVPMGDIDQVFWQAVMRQNTVIPPLRRLTLEQYIRALMYGEAVQMGAAIGAIGRPYVEYFSDPFIIGLEDNNANQMYGILKELQSGGLSQNYYVFNTGGVGADTNDEASGAHYKKIPREITLMLQEALLREAVKFEYEPILGSDVAVAIVDREGAEVKDLRADWLPKTIYGEQEYSRRILDLRRRRCYGRDAEDKAGILRYTKVDDALVNPSDIPTPINERELAWLVSFYWKVDQAYNTLQEVAQHRAEGRKPAEDRLRDLRQKYQDGQAQGLQFPSGAQVNFAELGITGRG